MKQSVIIAGWFNNLRLNSPPTIVSILRQTQQTASMRRIDGDVHLTDHLQANQRHDTPEAQAGGKTQSGNDQGNLC